VKSSIIFATLFPLLSAGCFASSADPAPDGTSDTTESSRARDDRRGTGDPHGDWGRPRPDDPGRPRPCPEADLCYERLSECRIAGGDCTDIAFECERHQQACQPPVPPCDAGAPSRCPEADACNERLTACRIRGGDCTDIAFECERHQQACQPPVPPPRCPEAEACYERLTACRIRGGDCTDIAFECERHQQACQPPPDPAVNCREAIVSCSERYYHCTTVPGLDCDDVRKFCSDLAQRCQQ
jgi:hypothetical protein